VANPLRTLQEYGQSVWLDFVSRDLLKSRGLAKLIAEDGLRGVTSNPSIFEKAIVHGDDYDAQIAALQASGDLDPGALFERLAVTDIQNGADALRPIYHQTEGRDGYISIEVSPYLAMDTGRTIEEARRLWREVARENLMVKIPATKPGLPAIRAMIAEGVSINITLLSPMPSSPISSTRKSTASPGGSVSRNKALRRSGCCGRAPEPRIRRIATSCMSTS